MLGHIANGYLPLCAASAAELGAGADAAAYSSKAPTPSRLKGDLSSTPVKPKLQKAGTAEPNTPGYKKQSSSTADDGLLSLSPQLLAPDLMLLNQLLGEHTSALPGHFGCTQCVIPPAHALIISTP